MVLILTLACAGAMALALAFRRWRLAGLFAVFAATPRAEWATVKEHATSVLDQSVVSVRPK